MTGTPLDPVRAEMLRQARAEAGAAVARAEAEAAQQRARARAEAEAILDEARARGRADADEALRAGAARARRQARSVGLRARHEVYQSWRDAVSEGVKNLIHTAEYPRILASLAARARALLGADAQIEEDPAGGLRAQVPGRRVDLTLEAVAARAVADAEGQASELWTP
jgi:vacuolar-type H+-ATPase subunit E/Vma4